MKIELGEIYQTKNGKQMLIVADVAKIAKARGMKVRDLYDEKLFIAVEVIAEDNKGQAGFVIDADIPNVFNSKGKEIIGDDFLLDKRQSNIGML